MLLGRVAQMYYKHGLTHQEIADALGLSRVRVTRLLAEAREKEIVEIIVHTEESLFADEERGLSARFALQQVHIAPSFADQSKTDRAFAVLGAETLGHIIEKDSVVALGLSLAVAQVVGEFPIRPLGASFVPLAGSSSGRVNGSNPNELALTLATRTSGSAFHLSAPLLAVSASAARSAAADPGVLGVLALAAQADILVAGLGGTTNRKGPLSVSLDETEREYLRSLGAVGDLAGRFFDSQGQAVGGIIDSRVVGLTLDQMRLIPKRVVVARGPSKVTALRAALSSGLVTTLVTDSETANELLEQASPSVTSHAS